MLGRSSCVSGGRDGVYLCSVGDADHQDRHHWQLRQTTAWTAWTAWTACSCLPRGINQCRAGARVGSWRDN